MQSSLYHAQVVRGCGRVPTMGAGGGGDWYAGEPVPGECVYHALPINDGMSEPWAQDLRRMWEVLWGLLEGGGVPAVEPLIEEDKEEERRRPSTAGKRAPL